MALNVMQANPGTIPGVTTAQPGQTITGVTSASTPTSILKVASSPTSGGSNYNPQITQTPTLQPAATTSTLMPNTQTAGQTTQPAAGQTFTLGNGAKYDINGNQLNGPTNNGGTPQGNQTGGYSTSGTIINQGTQLSTPTPTVSQPSTSLTNDTTYSDIQKLLSDNLKNMDSVFATMGSNSTVGPDEQAQQGRVATDAARVQTYSGKAAGLDNPDNQAIALPFLQGQGAQQLRTAQIQQGLDEAKLNYMQGNRTFAFNSAATMFDKAQGSLETALDVYTKSAPKSIGQNYNPSTGLMSIFMQNPFTGSVATFQQNIGPQKSIVSIGTPIQDPTTLQYSSLAVYADGSHEMIPLTGDISGNGSPITNNTQQTPSTLASGVGSLVSKTPNPQAVIATSTGMSYDMTSYASGNAIGGPASQAANIQQTLGKLQTMPITNAVSAQSAIQAIKPNSPITGQMVYSAAQHYGVDAGMLIATMQAESQLGTDGSKGSRGNNFGNVHNTDSLMASGGQYNYPTPQDGVNAVAQNLAQRQMQSKAQAGTTPTGLSYNDAYQVANTLVRPALKPAPDGSAYIDQGELKTETQQLQAQILSGKYNVPIKTPSEVSDIQGLQIALSNLSTVGTKFSEIASTNGVSTHARSISDPFSKWFGSARGNNVKAYGDNTEQLFQQVKTLATSSPRLSEQGFNLAKSALPTLYSDNMTSGQLKIAATQRYLDNAVRAYLPGFKGSILNFNGQFMVNDPQTNIPHVFPSYSAAQQALQSITLTPQ